MGGLEEEDGDAASHFLDVADFVFSERAAEKRLFAVGEPLLDGLIAANGVVPNANRNVGPVGDFVEVNVAGFVAEFFRASFPERLRVRAPSRMPCIGPAT